MAKKDEPRATKSKMTVMIFQLEGSDETLQEGLRKISDAAEKIIRPHTRTSPILLKSGDGEDESATPVAKGDAECTGEEDDIGIAANGSDADAQRESRKSRRVERTPRVVPIDQSKAKVSLQDFCKQKSAEEPASRRFMAIALWLRDQLGIAEFSVDHIYTCYKLAGWTDFPNHPGQMVRQLKFAGNLAKGAGKGLYAINHVGEAEVNRMPAKS